MTKEDEAHPGGHLSGSLSWKIKRNVAVMLDLQKPAHLPLLFSEFRTDFPKKLICANETKSSF